MYHVETSITAVQIRSLVFDFAPDGFAADIFDGPFDLANSDRQVERDPNGLDVLRCDQGLPPGLTTDPLRMLQGDGASAGGGFDVGLSLHLGAGTFLA